MKYYLLWDVDDTLLDFKKAERIAIAKPFRPLGIEPTVIRLTTKIAGVGGLYLFILWLMKSVILQDAIAFFLNKRR